MANFGFFSTFGIPCSFNAIVLFLGHLSTFKKDICCMSSEKKTALIVEDERDAAEMFAEMMRVTGFDVISLYSSTPAISTIAVEKPDLVLLDIMMPDVSGLEVLRYMRREPDLKDIPVILVSAKSMPADIQEGMEAGASNYLTKPIGFLELKSAVEALVSPVG